MPAYRSRTTTHGRNMAGARGLWRATGMKDEDFGKPIIAVVNSFTQFVPGHVHLKDLGQLVAREIEQAGGVAKEFNTIAVDDGIAMGHDGMLYSLPSRDLIADSVEYMVNAHCADAMVCISNCDKITPGMLMAAMRLNIPAVFVSGGPMEAGKVVLRPASPASSTSSTRWSPPPTTRSPTPTCSVDRALRLPDLRLVLGHVHRQLDELPDRGARPVAARQRLDARHPCRPPAPLRRGRPPDRRSRPPLLRAGRRERAAALDRELQGLRERHDARHRHGRLDQHRAAPARRRARGRRRLHDEGHRPPVAPRPGALQGRAVGRERPHGGRPPRRRHLRDPRRTRARRPHPPTCRPSTPPRSARRSTAGTSRGPIGERPPLLPRGAGRRADPGRLQPGQPLGRARPRPRQGRHPLGRERLHARTAASPCSTATSPRTAAS